MKAYKIGKKVEELQRKSEDPPWNVFRFVASEVYPIDIFGSQFSLGPNTDYGTCDEIRHALEWYVEQFGGKVKWEK